VAISDRKYRPFAEQRAALRSYGEVGLLLGVHRRKVVYDLGLDVWGSTLRRIERLLWGQEARVLGYVGRGNLLRGRLVHLGLVLDGTSGLLLRQGDSG
jgi:hypothetical protein